MSTEITEIPCPKRARVCPMSISGEEWPPQLKPFKDSAEYCYVGQYFTLMNFEVNRSLYPFQGRFPIESYLTFLNQVRESWGYDVTFTVPGSNLYPVNGAVLEEGRSLYNQQCKFVVDKINDQAKMHGEFYVFQSVEKLVSISPRRVKLYTFTVKEVESNRLKTVRACLYCETCNRIHIHGWNFKPDDNPPPSSFDSPPPLSPEWQRPPPSSFEWQHPPPLSPEWQRPPPSPKKKKTPWSRMKSMRIKKSQKACTSRSDESST